MPDTPPLILGVEGGATKTDWLLLEEGEDGLREKDRGRLPAANFHLLSPEELEALLRRLPSEADRVGVFLAGCASQDRPALEELVARVWPDAIRVVGSDLESGLAAALGADDGIIVIAGTGSAVHGRRGERTERAGGWGHYLGDRGSAFDIAVHGLRHSLRIYDVEGEAIPMARAFLRELGLNSLRDLVDWAQHADKLEVARLSPIVFEAAESDEESEVNLILDVAARRLAEYTGAVARRLELERPRVRLLGGVFTHQSRYVDFFRANLARFEPDAEVAVCRIPGAEGAAFLARQAHRPVGKEGAAASPPRPPASRGEMPPRIRALASAPTEQANPRADDLDRKDTAALVELFLEDQATVSAALAARKGELGAAVDLVHDCLSRPNGRLFYFGAGTSGRLGVLDASEIPPTFRASPNLVQGIIAGGNRALHQAVEGAEDNAAAGALAVIDRGVGPGDVACGITASGNTPFVEGALREARARGAHTLLITCNPNRYREEGAKPWDVEIDLPTGPEFVAGSTRLKAGTATKLALNLISTCTMIRLGKVRGNLMIDLNASNEKLRDRAARIVSRLRGCDYEEAMRLLEAHDWRVRDCLD